MTNVLERVIEDQQKKIDELTKEVDSLETARRARVKDIQDFYADQDVLFKLLNRLVNRSAFNRIKHDSPDYEEWLHDVRMFMLDKKWCMNCETTGCWGDCYD